MRFLADMGVSMTTVQVLQEHGHEVIHLRTGGYGRLCDAIVIVEDTRYRLRRLPIDLK